MTELSYKISLGLRRRKKNFIKKTYARLFWENVLELSRVKLKIRYPMYPRCTVSLVFHPAGLLLFCKLKTNDKISNVSEILNVFFWWFRLEWSPLFWLLNLQWNNIANYMLLIYIYVVAQQKDLQFPLRLQNGLSDDASSNPAIISCLPTSLSPTSNTFSK